MSEPGALGFVTLDSEVDAVGVGGVVGTVGFAAIAGTFKTCISSYLLVRPEFRTFLVQADRANGRNWRAGRAGSGGRRA